MVRFATPPADPGEGTLYRNLYAPLIRMCDPDRVRRIFGMSAVSVCRKIETEGIQGLLYQKIVQLFREEEAERLGLQEEFHDQALEAAEIASEPTPKAVTKVIERAATEQKKVIASADQDQNEVVKFLELKKKDDDERRRREIRQGLNPKKN
ncbi:MAG: hypothetical protein Q7R81_05520 [Candidatus Peregrinibacteria bacterium]|nr:hypothetical protein [Candidatus Peregrinibacteria bacterium]